MTTELLDTDLRLASALMQTRRDLEDAQGAIHGKTYAACELELLEP